MNFVTLSVTVYDYYYALETLLFNRYTYFSKNFTYRKLCH